MDDLLDIRIKSVDRIKTPEEIEELYPLSTELRNRVKEYRQSVNDIITGNDKRKVAIVGPCSIHDFDAAIDYANRLKKLSDVVSDQLFIIMRTYFEKARTSVGWKGLILDPDLNGDFNIEKGITLARALLLEITRIGVPVGCEILDPIIPQYIDGLISWASIGARTTESQIHRNLVSGLSYTVGFKNSTSGDFMAAVNGMKSAKQPASFLGVSRDGMSMIFRTNGNDSCHVILRGSDTSPNYYEEDVEKVEAMLEQNGLRKAIVIDCSHGNSRKDYTKQIRVARNVVEQIIWGKESIKGFMLESNIKEGKQEIKKDKSLLEYGVSITDSCIGWEETERSLRKIAELLRHRKIDTI